MTRQHLVPPRLDDGYVLLPFLCAAHASGNHSANSFLVLATNSPGGPPDVCVVVDDVPMNAPPHEHLSLLAPMLCGIRQGGGTDFVVVLCREGSVHVGGDDLGWDDAVRELADQHVRCRGVFFALPHGVVPTHCGSAAPATRRPRS